MLALVFPAKKHPEDTNPVFSLAARAVFWFGVICFIGSSYFLFQWARSMSFEKTRGVVEYGGLRWVGSHVTNVSFDYMVDNTRYTSQNIAIGGRPLGGVPPAGPIDVYYNPNDPAEAVIQRRPIELVYISFAFSLLSPFLARLIWRFYA